MEALSLSANVAAFVVVAAQLSTVLYTTFSSIKDGPDNVRRVTAHLLQLHGVLEQLRCSSLASSDTALAGHVGLCVLDLNSLADNVQKLQLTPYEARTGRLWKRFKSFLDEKKLDRICDQIVAHTGTLSLRLSILNSVEKQTESLISKFGDVDNTLHTQHDELQNGLTSIQAAVGDMVHMSQTKADSMLDLLAEIKNSIVNLTRGACQPGTVTGNTSEQGSESNNEEVWAEKNVKSVLHANLVQSITRLCCLVKEKNRTFDTDAEDNTQAEDIIEDLQMLLDSAQRYETTVSSTIAHRSINRKLLRSDLRRFGQAFGQFKLLVNQEARRDDGSSSTAIRRKRTYTTVFLQGLGTLSLMVTKQDQGSSATEVISKMVFSFLPKDPRQFMMIVASTTQGGMPGGSISPISRLAVNRVLPAGSQVFHVVEKGLLQELRAMLQRDEATLRDHDEYGANLLFYAVWGRQAKICKFLLENGADVDHVANSKGLTWGRTDDQRLFNNKDIAERICQVLDAGVNVHLHDYRGQSCLHTCLQTAKLQFRRSHNLIRSQFHAIKLLIERGANVYAVNLDGESVSELAYIEMSGYSFCGGLVGDLWDAALQSCGYDIAKFRKYHKRKGYYTNHYPREAFEVLWEGREDQCPYWDDATWPPDEPEGLGGSLAIANMGEDGILTSKGWCWQEQQALENLGEIDSYVRSEASETQTELASTVEEDADDKRNTARKQGCEFVTNVEFSGLFENPWI
ncbi:hypothetical protein E0Z10_g7345 [Xylaria hypoxylon]|uniref:Azaphilone pigments biosynthesis cluster protein L N-terminal domain-containing protein n=1 Tax=Xylaria hypoxylon TaxID=37992 RepID=A0A4Z0YBV0_9PEZI|nr:hypothetical protein E0Z10_g7345 [Xylaria hypoxylon]